jgi:hypothetical protein
MWNTMGIVEVALLAAAKGCGTPHGNNDSNLQFNQVRSERGQPIEMTLCPAEFDRHVTAFDKASFVQAAANCGHVFGIGRRWRGQDANNRHGLLSAGCGWPHDCSPNQRNELPPPHCTPHPQRVG